MERKEAQSYSDIIMKRIEEDISLFKLSPELYNENENAQTCEDTIQCIEEHPVYAEQFWSEGKELVSIIKLNDICKSLTRLLPETIRREVNSHINDLIEECFAE